MRIQAKKHREKRRQLLINVKDKNRLLICREQYTISNAASARPFTLRPERSARLAKHKRSTRNGHVNNHIAEHHIQTKHQIDGDLPHVLRILRTTINDLLVL